MVLLTSIPYFGYNKGDNMNHDVQNFVPMIKQVDGNRVIYQDPISLLFEKSRTIFLGLPVDSAYTNISIVPSLLVLDNADHKKPIKMYINSPGGSITDGLAILDTMQYIKAPVHTVIIGQAASMAAVIAAAGEKGHRLALPSARILIHQPWQGGGGGQQSDIEIQAKEIKRLRDFLEAKLAKATGQSIGKIHMDCERDYIMSAEEALTYGIIDKIVGVTKED